MIAGILNKVSSSIAANMINTIVGRFSLKAEMFFGFKDYLIISVLY